MRRWRLWPASLFGRTTLILFLGLAAAHVLSFWLVVFERSQAMRGMMVGYLASDVASSIAILERLRPEERAEWLVRLQRPGYRFLLEAPADAVAGNAAGISAQAEAISRAVATALLPQREVRALEVPADGIALRLQLRLADGAPVAVDLAEPRLRISPWVVGVLGVQLLVLAALSWLAVRLATRPLRQLADAADGLTPAQPGLPLAEDGPHEVARAAAAFNTMQGRIRSHLDERMQILAAVSHDLQTPITRLRLRADLLDDTALRGKLLADLAEMQSLVEEGIAYARSGQAGREPEQAVELQALLESIVFDYTDAGRPVQLAAQGLGTCRTRPQALRRLVCNLVDNALKFAGAAEVEAHRATDGRLVLRVLDRGPGIPDEELEAVLQPFYRVESSRSRATGGTGLGLAIARQLAEALRGRLVLAAREGGGLEARLEVVAWTPDQVRGDSHLGPG